MEGHLEKYPPHSQLIHNHDAEVYAPIASCFFNFPVCRARPDFYRLQFRITCKSGWTAQAPKRYCVSKGGKYRNRFLSCGNFIKKSSTFCLDINLETDNPSKMNFPSVSTSSRRANRRILLHYSSYHRIYTWMN